MMALYYVKPNAHGGIICANIMTLHEKDAEIGKNCMKKMQKLHFDGVLLENSIKKLIFAPHYSNSVENQSGSPVMATRH